MKTYDDLKGKVVRTTLSRRDLHGTRYGVVRRVVTKKAVLAGLTFTMLSDSTAASLDARYRGQRAVLKGTETDDLAVKLRSGRFVSLADWLSGNTTKPTNDRS